eukprot:PhF_6_TR26691/c1_g2_i2/m.38905
MKNMTRSEYSGHVIYRLLMQDMFINVTSPSTLQFRIDCDVLFENAIYSTETQRIYINDITLPPSPSATVCSSRTLPLTTIVSKSQNDALVRANMTGWICAAEGHDMTSDWRCLLSSGGKVVYTNWGPGEPKNTTACIYFDQQGLWWTRPCNEEHYGICTNLGDVFWNPGELEFIVSVERVYISCRAVVQWDDANPGFVTLSYVLLTEGYRWDVNVNNTVMATLSQLERVKITLSQNLSVLLINGRPQKMTTPKTIQIQHDSFNQTLLSWIVVPPNITSSPLFNFVEISPSNTILNIPTEPPTSSPPPPPTTAPMSPTVRTTITTVSTVLSVTGGGPALGSITAAIDSCGDETLKTLTSSSTLWILSPLTVLFHARGVEPEEVSPVVFNLVLAIAVHGLHYIVVFALIYKLAPENVHKFKGKMWYPYISFYCTCFLLQGTTHFTIRYYISDDVSALWGIIATMSTLLLVASCFGLCVYAIKNGKTCAMTQYLLYPTAGIHPVWLWVRPRSQWVSTTNSVVYAVLYDVVPERVNYMFYYVTYYVCVGVLTGVSDRNCD